MYLIYLFTFVELNNHCKGFFYISNVMSSLKRQQSDVDGDGDDSGDVKRQKCSSEVKSNSVLFQTDMLLLIADFISTFNIWYGWNRCCKVWNSSVKNPRMWSLRYLDITKPYIEKIKLLSLKEFDLSSGFPFLFAKKIHVKVELYSFLVGLSCLRNKKLAFPLPFTALTHFKHHDIAQIGSRQHLSLIIMNHLFQSCKNLCSLELDTNQHNYSGAVLVTFTPSNFNLSSLTSLKLESLFVPFTFSNTELPLLRHLKIGSLFPHSTHDKSQLFTGIHTLITLETLEIKDMQYVKEWKELIYLKHDSTPLVIHVFPVLKELNLTFKAFHFDRTEHDKDITIFDQFHAVFPSLTKVIIDIDITVSSYHNDFETIFVDAPKQVMYRLNVSLDKCQHLETISTAHPYFPVMSSTVTTISIRTYNINPNHTLWHSFCSFSTIRHLILLPHKPGSYNGVDHDPKLFKYLHLFSNLIRLEAGQSRNFAHQVITRYELQKKEIDSLYGCKHLQTLVLTQFLLPYNFYQLIRTPGHLPKLVQLLLPQCQLSCPQAGFMLFSKDKLTEQFDMICTK